jgi:hypothetical protein
MTYFPNEVFSNIISYCDDTMEIKHKKHYKEINNQITNIYRAFGTWNPFLVGPENTATIIRTFDPSRSYDTSEEDSDY